MTSVTNHNSNNKRRSGTKQRHLNLDNRSHIPVCNKSGGSLHCTVLVHTVGYMHYTSLNPRTSFSAIRGGNPFNISTKTLHSPKHAAVDLALLNSHSCAHFQSLNFLAFTALTFLRQTTSAPGFKAFATWARTVAVATNPCDDVAAVFGVFAAFWTVHG